MSLCLCVCVVADWIDCHHEWVSSVNTSGDTSRHFQQEADYIQVLMVPSPTAGPRAILLQPRQYQLARNGRHHFGHFLGSYNKLYNTLYSEPSSSLLQAFPNFNCLIMDHILQVFCITLLMSNLVNSALLLHLGPPVVDSILFSLQSRRWVNWGALLLWSGVKFK